VQCQYETTPPWKATRSTADWVVMAPTVAPAQPHRRTASRWMANLVVEGDTLRVAELYTHRPTLREYNCRS